MIMCHSNLASPKDIILSKLLSVVEIFFLSRRTTVCIVFVFQFETFKFKIDCEFDSYNSDGETYVKSYIYLTFKIEPMSDFSIGKV